MNHIDPDEFVSLMRPEMERVADLAVRKRAAAIPIIKSDQDEDSVEHEPSSEARIGVLSTVDLEIQETLLRFAYERWPFISVLAEENTKTKPKFKPDSIYYLLVDPIDGTKQYLAGGSEFCHTISLMTGNTMLVSMIYSHQKKKLFVAIAKRGAYILPRESAPERLALTSDEGNVFLCHVSRISSELLCDLRTLGYDVKPSSQNATDILSMLDGGIIGFISLSPGVYDVWSPAAVIQEAGGWLSDWLGSSLQFDRKTRIPNILVSTSEKIARHTLPVLKRYLSPQ